MMAMDGAKYHVEEDIMTIGIQVFIIGSAPQQMKTNPMGAETLAT